MRIAFAAAGWCAMATRERSASPNLQGFDRTARGRRSTARRGARGGRGGAQHRAGRCRAGARAGRGARAAGSAAARRRYPLSGSGRSAASRPGRSAGAAHRGGDVLPHGCVFVHGRDAQGSGEALLYVAVPVLEPQVSEGGTGLHPAHRSGAGSRRGHLLQRHAGRQHQSGVGTRQNARDHRAALPASHYNIFGAQASDGDSFGADSTDSSAYLLSQLLPFSRYFVYAEVGDRPEKTGSTSLWSAYSDIEADHFNMASVRTRERGLPGARQAVPTRATGLSGMQELAQQIHRQRMDAGGLARHRAHLRAACGALRARHLSQSNGSHHQRADARQLRLERTAGELWALELRQALPDRERQVSIGAECARLRNRHQHQPMHRLPHGRQFARHAGAGHSACLLRAQQLLEGQLSVQAVDAAGRGARLHAVRAQLRRRLRGALRIGTRRTDARCPARAARSGVGQVQAPAQARYAQGARRAGEALVDGAGEHAPGRVLQRGAARGQGGEHRSGFSRRAPRKTCCISSRSTRRSSSPGSASWRASCARSRSISIRSARPR
jgi:hypothetical protein